MDPDAFRRLGFDAADTPARIDSNTLIVNDIFEQIPQLETV